MENIMNKTKTALTIVRLLGIAFLLAIALTTTILMEGLQIIVNLIQNPSELERRVIAPIESCSQQFQIQKVVKDTDIKIKFNFLRFSEFLLRRF